MSVLAVRLDKSLALIQLFFVVVIIYCALGLFPAQAQDFDPSLIEALKKSGSDRVADEPTSPLDQSRQIDRRIGAEDADETEEEIAAKRERREAELRRVSLLEEDYEARSGVSLRQFGYDVFLKQEYEDVRLATGAVNRNYILGIDDELIVTFTGAKTGSQTVYIDREGKIYLDGLSPVMAAGKNFNALEQELKDKVEDAFIGSDVHLSLASVRNIAVYVFGEVLRPGQQYVASLSGVFEVLSAVGGVRKEGSLRNIKVIRNGKTHTIDLYAFLLGGKDQDLSLRDGDRVVVPPIGATIAVTGGVKRPGIFELPAESGVLETAEALALSGGTIRPRGYTYLLNTMAPNGHQEVKSLQGVSIVGDGDIISVSLSQNTRSGRVTLGGSVRAGGVRSLDQVQTVLDLVEGTENLAQSTYLPFAVIETTNPNTLIRELKPFNLEDVLRGKRNILLKSDDRVFILNRKDVDFLSSDLVRKVLMGGRAPQYDEGAGEERCEALHRLNKIVQDSAIDRFPTALRSVFIAQTRLSNRFESYVKSSSQMSGDNVCPEVFQKLPELLVFALEHVVTIDGSVRKAGVYPVSGRTSVAGLLSIAGGVAENADLTNMEVLMTDDSLQIGDYRRERINGLQTNLEQVTVSLGGGLRVNTRFTQQERGTVLLSGEVKYPGVYTIRRGEKMSEILARAGGLTEQAYAYGAVFTRERVKKTQHEEMRRSQAHIRSALLSAMTKKDASQDLIEGAEKLLATLTAVEVMGRVVIEADPEKLAVNTALDTVLEPGDVLHIPKRPGYVIALGDVLSPGAFQHKPEKTVTDYIEEVGGLTSFADEDRVYIVYPNGVAKPVNISSWGFSGDVSLPPGTTIVVPTDVSPYDTLLLVKEISTVFSQLAVSAASIAVISR